jgi:hypothetical protein
MVLMAASIVGLRARGSQSRKHGSSRKMRFAGGQAGFWVMLEPPLGGGAGVPYVQRLR